MLLISFFMFATGFGLVAWKFFEYSQLLLLKADRINSTAFCNLHNRYVMIEYGIQAAFAICCLFKGLWLSALLNAAVAAYHGKKASEGRHLFDELTVWNRGVLEEHQKSLYAKGSLYLVLAVLASFHFAAQLLGHF